MGADANDAVRGTGARRGYFTTLEEGVDAVHRKPITGGGVIEAWHPGHERVDVLGQIRVAARHDVTP